MYSFIFNGIGFVKNCKVLKLIKEELMKSKLVREV